MKKIGLLKAFVFGLSYMVFCCSDAIAMNSNVQQSNEIAYAKFPTAESAALRERVTRKNNQIKTLYTNINTLRKQRERLKEENDGLRDWIKAQNDQLDVFREEIVALQRYISEQRIQIEGLQKEKKALYVLFSFSRVLIHALNETPVQLGIPESDFASTLVQVVEKMDTSAILDILE